MRNMMTSCTGPTAASESFIPLPLELSGGFQHCELMSLARISKRWLIASVSDAPDGPRGGTWVGYQGSLALGLISETGQVENISCS